MNTVEKLTSALGRPRVLREIRNGDHLLAAVGRWCHQGASVDLSDTDTVQLIFNISGGQFVAVRRGGRSSGRLIRAGSVGVISPGIPTSVFVRGSADTVQVILSRALIEAAADAGAPQMPVRLAGSEARLQAVAAQALVALARGPQESWAELDRVIRQLAWRLARPAVTSLPRLTRGGLSPAARRRVQGLLEQRLQADWCAPLALRELAATAGLSVHHFVKAFRETEGSTPHANMLARRLDLALNLLLQPRARVDWIAEQTGFSSPAHFVSVFRQHLGVTPGALRDAADAWR